MSSCPDVVPTAHRSSVLVHCCIARVLCALCKPLVVHGLNLQRFAYICSTCQVISQISLVYAWHLLRFCFWAGTRGQSAQEAAAQPDRQAPHSFCHTPLLPPDHKQALLTSGVYKQRSPACKQSAECPCLPCGQQQIL